MSSREGPVRIVPGILAVVVYALIKILWMKMTFIKHLFLMLMDIMLISKSIPNAPIIDNWESFAYIQTHFIQTWDEKSNNM